MNHSVFWTNTAQEDLLDIVDFISHDSLRNAKDLFSKIKSHCNALKKFPLRGRIVPELKNQNIHIYHELIVSVWRIIYKIEDKHVYILAVIDGRRNVEDIILDRILREKN